MERVSPYRLVVGEILIRWKYLIPTKVIVDDPVGLKQSWPGVEVSPGVGQRGDKVDGVLLIESWI